MRCDAAAAVHVADAIETACPAARTPSSSSWRDRMRHQALRRTPCRSGRCRRSTTTTSSPARAPWMRGGQTGRSAARDQQVDHVSLASAAFSTPIRIRSSAALSTVNTTAVTHAECTSGSAMPSTTTAT